MLGLGVIRRWLTCRRVTDFRPDQKMEEIIEEILRRSDRNRELGEWARCESDGARRDQWNRKRVKCEERLRELLAKHEPELIKYLRPYLEHTGRDNPYLGFSCAEARRAKIAHFLLIRWRYRYSPANQ